MPADAWSAPSAARADAPGALDGGPHPAGGWRPAAGGEGALAEAASTVLNKLTDQSFAAEEGRFGLARWTAEHGPKLKALVFDASGLTRFEQLIELRNFFQPAFRAWASARAWWSWAARRSR